MVEFAANHASAAAAGAGRPVWRILGGRALSASAPFGIMGIVNVTPDSFFDGGEHMRTEQAVAHALRLRDEGADMLDLGAESSRPGARSLSADEELRRLLPVLCRLQTAASGVCLSVDTYHAATADAVLRCGASVINDISGCVYDPALLDVLVQYRPGYVLMHRQGRPATMQNAPRYDDVRRDVLEFFDQMLNRLVRAGLPEEHIVLDPGIGFGKTLEHNLALLAHAEEWLRFGRPVLMGLSMKSLFGDLLGLPVSRRGAVTQTATALLWQKGIFWHRVHDVPAARQGLTLAAALRSGGIAAC